MNNLKKIAFGVFAMMFALVNVHAETNEHYAHITNASGACTIQDEDDFAAAMEWDYTKTQTTPCTEFVIDSEISITKEVSLDNISIRIDAGGKLTVDGGKLTLTHHKSVGSNKYSIKLNDATAELDIVNGGYVQINDAQGYGILASSVGTINVSGTNSKLNIYNLGAAGIKNVNEINVSDDAVIDIHGVTGGSGISTEGTLKVTNATVTSNENQTGIYAKVVTEGNSNIQVYDNTRIGLTLTDDSVIGGTTSVEATGNGPEDARADLAIDVDVSGHAPIIADSASVVTDSIVNYTESNGDPKGTIYNLKIEGEDAYLAYNTTNGGAQVVINGTTKGVVKKGNTVTVYSSSSKEVTVDNGDKVINNSGDDITVKVNNSDDTFVLASGDTKTIKATVKEPEQEPTNPADPTPANPAEDNKDQTANVGDENAQQTPADATEAPNTNTVPKTGDNIVSIMGLGLASIVITAVSAKNLKKQTVR